MRLLPGLLGFVRGAEEALTGPRRPGHTGLARFVREVSLPLQYSFLSLGHLLLLSSCLHTHRAYRRGGAGCEVEGLASNRYTGEL